MWFFSPRSPTNAFSIYRNKANACFDHSRLKFLQHLWQIYHSWILFQIKFKVQLHGSGMVSPGQADAQTGNCVTAWAIDGSATWCFKFYCTVPIATFHMIAGCCWESLGWDPDAPGFGLSWLPRKQLQCPAVLLSCGWSAQGQRHKGHSTAEMQTAELAVTAWNKDGPKSNLTYGTSFMASFFFQNVLHLKVLSWCIIRLWHQCRQTTEKFTEARLASECPE